MLHNLFTLSSRTRNTYETLLYFKFTSAESSRLKRCRTESVRELLTYSFAYILDTRELIVQCSLISRAVAVCECVCCVTCVQRVVRQYDSARCRTAASLAAGARRLVPDPALFRPRARERCARPVSAHSHPLLIPLLSSPHLQLSISITSENDTSGQCTHRTIQSQCALQRVQW